MSQQSSSVWHWMRKRVGGVFKTVTCVGWYAIDICSLGQQRLQGKEMLRPIRQVWASLGRGKEGPRIRHRWHRLTILHLLDLCVAQQPKSQALGPLILSVEVILILLLSLFVDIRFWSQWILLRVFFFGGICPIWPFSIPTNMNTKREWVPIGFFKSMPLQMRLKT